MAKRKELIFNLGSAHISAGLFLLEDNLTLQEFYTYDLQPESGTEEEWLKLLEDTLPEFTKKNRLSGKARFILPGSLVLSKTIRVPKVEESKKRKIVEYELSQKLPFPIKDLTWDFSVIDDDGIEEEILSFAIKPEVAHRLSKIIFSCGCTPTHFIPAAILDHEAIDATPSTEDIDCMFLNMGAKSTNIIFKNKTGFLVRTINLGGNALTEIISEQLAINFSKSEQLKLQFLSGNSPLNQDDPNQAKLLSALQTFLNKFAQELSRAIVTYKRLKKGRTPQNIFVSGRCIKVQGLLNTLSNSQRLPVNYFNPYDLFTLDVQNFAEDILADLPYTTSETAGLAIKLSTETSNDYGLNLLPKKKIKEIESRKKLPWYALSCLFFCLLPLPLLLDINNNVQNLKDLINLKSKEIQKIEIELKRNKKNNDHLIDLQKLNSLSADFLINLCKNTNHTASVLEFLNALQSVIDDPVNENTWIDSVDFYIQKNPLSSLDSDAKENYQRVNISGRYIVKIEQSEPALGVDQKRLALIDSNGKKQESLTNSISNLKQVSKVLNKVFSTEGKGDLYNRQFTHFEFDLDLDLLR
jgi:type IV pilus assembly protein PilM